MEMFEPPPSMKKKPSFRQKQLEEVPVYEEHIQ